MAGLTFAGSGLADRPANLSLKSSSMKFLSLKHRQLLSMVVGHIVFCCLLSVATPATAQSLDTEPPKVGSDTVDEARKGDSQVFTVSATDNQAIDSIAIFYRLGEDAAYVRGNMSRIGDTDLFTFTIPASAIPASVSQIDYYIEARDTTGNRALQGFSFQPITRTLVEGGTLADASSSSTPAESTSLLGSLSTTQKVVLGVVGVAVIGALIGAAGGGSDGGGSSDDNVPVLITSDPLL